MAILIPSLSSCLRRMTPGEKRFAERLVKKLEDDYLCWYDIPMGHRARYPDFMVLHPRRGLLVLEVKDWRLQNIQSVDKASCTVLTDRGHKVLPNPFEQARQYAQAICNVLERDPLLIKQEGQYQNRLCFPYGYGVVLTNIDRRSFEKSELDAVLDPSRVICQDEMLEAVDPEAFQQRLWNMFTVNFKTELTLPQIDRIRWNLFPEIRIRGTQEALALEVEEPLKPGKVLPDLIKVMDLQQEQLARNLGEGHRVIHGVAGSGKTLILGYRCERLAPVLTKPILVLCYNRVLASKLHSVMAAKNLGDKVNVRNFHGWCMDQLTLYNVPKPPNDYRFYDNLIEAVVNAVEKGQIPRAQYGAVMIDEGHDFMPEWLKLVTQMVDPETNSLLLLYDDAQSIYEAQRRKKFSFSSVGIQAQGRTTILRLNYRNTAQILNLAHEFAKDFLVPKDAEEDGIPLVQPQSAGVHGPLPVVHQLPNLQAEADFIAKEFKMVNKAGWAWRDLAVVYRSRFIGEQVSQRLSLAGVPVEWLGAEKGGKRYDPNSDTVKIVTMHSSKGLEFPVVAIPGLGYMPSEKFKPEDEGRLLYVAMTRAMEMLVMTSHRETDFTKRITEARRQIAA